MGGYHTEYSSMKFAQFFMGNMPPWWWDPPLSSRCSWGLVHRLRPGRLAQ
ncbi:MAG: hypothetical protein ACLSUW_00355 [Akkermansia sp.]